MMSIEEDIVLKLSTSLSACFQSVFDSCSTFGSWNTVFKHPNTLVAFYPLEAT